jgi:hypothetical protein
MFDLDDEYQAKLYEHLKQRTNGSSYIRSLIHQDLFGGSKSSEPPQPKYEVIKEQINNNITENDERPVADVKPDVKSAIIKQATHHGNIKININNNSIIPDEEDVFIYDLI